MQKMSLFLGLLLFGQLSCNNGDSGPGPDQAKGYATGHVVDAQGKPMEGVSIILDNTLISNSFLEGTTDSEGNYLIKTDFPASTFIAYAEIERDYNGRHYRLSLQPDKTAGFSGQEGAVRNFQWNLSGEDVQNPGSYYGGTVSIDSDIHSQLYDSENLEFTFTPAGPLIDGSTGQAFKRQLNPELNNELRGVPIARYRITAVYKPTGQLVKLKFRPNGAYTADGSVTADFQGVTGHWACTNCMYLEYLE